MQVSDSVVVRPGAWIDGFVLIVCVPEYSTRSVACVLYGLVPGAPADASWLTPCGVTFEPPLVDDGIVTLTCTFELPLPRTPLVLELVALPPRELVTFVFMLEPPPWLIAVDEDEDCELEPASAVCAWAPIVVIANSAAHATLILLLFISLSGRGLTSDPGNRTNSPEFLQFFPASPNCFQPLPSWDHELPAIPGHCWETGPPMALPDESVCCCDGLVVWVGLFDVCEFDCTSSAARSAPYAVRDASIRAAAICFCFMPTPYGDNDAGKETSIAGKPVPPRD